MATATRTVRIKPETHEKLQKMARDSKRSLPEVLDEAISEYERRIFLEGLSEDYARLRADPIAWQEELDERALWDCTLLDGLRDDPPYPPEAMLSEEDRSAKARVDEEKNA